MKKLLITGLLAAALSTAPGCADDIKAEKVYQGNVLSFGLSGYHCPTHELTFAPGGNDRSQELRFSLDSEKRHGEDLELLAKQLTDAVEKDQKVRLYVKEHREHTTAFCRPDTIKFVYKVEPIE